METASAPTTERKSQWPAAQSLALNDLLEAVAAGLRDFRAALPHSLAFGALYAIGGWVLILLLIVFDLPYLVYPLAMGFALIAPFVATGLYAISDALEKKERVAWAPIWAAIRLATWRDLGWMALVTGFAFFLWIDIAAFLVLSFFGFKAFVSWGGFLDLLGTPSGLLFLLVGNIAGAVIATIVFSISVTSFPMLFDRDCDFVTAMVTSVRVVIANPKVMLIWCATIAVLVGLSLLSGLVGLLVVLPVLGHATWHLYRRAVAAE